MAYKEIQRDEPKQAVKMKKPKQPEPGKAQAQVVPECFRCIHALHITGDSVHCALNFGGPIPLMLGCQFVTLPKRQEVKK